MGEHWIVKMTKRRTKMMKVKGKFHIASISWPDKDAKIEAQERARELGMTLSSYINMLVMNDIDKGGDVTVKPRKKKQQKK